MNNETLLYGRKIGDPEWMEVILCSQPERFDLVREMATKDGFSHFRESVIDLSTPPDFRKTVRK